MTNPSSLRLRIQNYYRSHSVKGRTPSLTECEAAIQVVAQATNLTPDELSRKIELSDVTIPPTTPDYRQLVLFGEPALLGPLKLKLKS